VTVWSKWTPCSGAGAQGHHWPLATGWLAAAFSVVQRAPSGSLCSLDSNRPTTVFVMAAPETAAPALRRHTNVLCQQLPVVKQTIETDRDSIQRVHTIAATVSGHFGQLLALTEQATSSPQAFLQTVSGETFRTAAQQSPTRTGPTSLSSLIVTISKAAAPLPLHCRRVAAPWLVSAWRRSCKALHRALLIELITPLGGKLAPAFHSRFAALWPPLSSLRGPLWPTLQLECPLYGPLLLRLPFGPAGWPLAPLGA